MSRSSRRLLLMGILLLGAAALSAVTAQEGKRSNRVEGEPTAGEPPAERDFRASGTAVKSFADTQPAAQIVREGTKLTTTLGTFSFAGERMAFFPDGGGERIVALENLTLERISRTISESSEKQVWSIRGEITEFNGKNYVLVQRAVLTASDSPGAAAP